MLSLEELKQKTSDRFVELEKERLEDIVEFEIPNIGTVKLAPPMPAEAHKLMIQAAPMLSREDEVEAQAAVSWIANESYLKLLIMTCFYEPVLDAEGYDSLMQVLSTNERLELINKCFELSSGVGEEIEENLVKVENFTEGTPGPSSE